MAWTYILHCADGSFYTGSTNGDLEARVWEHNHDDVFAANFTRKRRPVRLVYAEQFETVDAAFYREKADPGMEPGQEDRADRVARIRASGAVEIAWSGRFDKLSAPERGPRFDKLGAPQRGPRFDKLSDPDGMSSAAQNESGSVTQNETGSAG